MSPAWSDGVATVYLDDALTVLRTLPSESVYCCVTSPPYWGLREYGLGDQGIGLERTPEEWMGRLVEVFREVRRVLRDDATLWVNCGDAYASGGRDGSTDHSTTSSPIPRGPAHRAPSPGLKPKDLLGLPWMLAFALRADGWYLRSDSIWAKPNPMPESVTDRPTSAHEHLFLLSKRERYYYDAEAIREPAEIGDHPRNVREVLPSAVPGAAPHTGIRYQPAHIPAGWDLDLHGRAGYGRFKQDGYGRRHEGFNGRYFDENWVAALPHLRPRRGGERACHPRAVGGPARPDHPPLMDPYSRNRRNVWTVATHPYPEAHFATFPEQLVEPCILAGCPEWGTMLDPFAGSGTTLAVAKRLNRDSIGIELNPAYLPLIVRRCEREVAQPELPLELSRAEN